MAPSYVRKEGYMDSQEGIGRTYTCLCQRANDVKLLGTTECLIQNSAMVVLLHEYGRFLGAYIMRILCNCTNIVIFMMPGSVRVRFITLLAIFPHMLPLMALLFLSL
jgi:hypothetical protein